MSFSVFSMHCSWIATFVSVFAVVESWCTLNLAACKWIGEWHLLIFAQLKISSYCAKHYKLEVLFKNKRMRSVVKCSNLAQSIHLLNFSKLKLKERSTCYTSLETMGHNFICKWWHCLVKRKNLRTVARDIVCTHGVYGNWACTKRVMRNKEIPGKVPSVRKTMIM